MAHGVIIEGLAADSAGIKGLSDTGAALKAIASAGAPCASRGEDGQTHKREIAPWSGTEFDPATHASGWYRENGADVVAAGRT